MFASVILSIAQNLNNSYNRLKMSDSWLLNPTVPSYGRSLPTQSTAFGTSSLASSSASAIAYDDGRQTPTLRYMTGGNLHHNNLVIVDQDKSSLGIDNQRRIGKLRYSKPQVGAETVPNVNSLDSKYRLHHK